MVGDHREFKEGEIREVTPNEAHALIDAGLAALYENVIEEEVVVPKKVSKMMEAEKPKPRKLVKKVVKKKKSKKGRKKKVKKDSKVLNIGTKFYKTK